MAEPKNSAPGFYYFQGDEGSFLVNVDQIKMVDEIQDGHCRLLFGNDYRVSLNGKGASELVAFLIANSKLLDGTAFAEMWEGNEKAKAAKSE